MYTEQNTRKGVSLSFYPAPLSQDQKDRIRNIIKTYKGTERASRVIHFLEKLVEDKSLNQHVQKKLSKEELQLIRARAIEVILILETLTEDEQQTELCVQEIAAVLKQSTVSDILKKLKRLGLVRYHQDGYARYYFLEVPVWNELKQRILS